MGQLAVFVFLVLAEVLMPGVDHARAEVLERYLPVAGMDLQRDALGLTGFIGSDLIFRTEQSGTRAELHLVQIHGERPVLVDLSDLLSRFRSADAGDGLTLDFETGDSIPFDDLSGPLIVSHVGDSVFMALPEHDTLFVIDIF